MNCPDCFTCEACKKSFHRDRPIEQAYAEHEHRKQTIPDYDDGEEPVEVCDDCFNIIMRNA